MDHAACLVLIVLGYYVEARLSDSLTILICFIFKYNDLMKKKKIVENDKRKIEEVIQELDMKKNDALKKAWEQVNKVFYLRDFLYMA